MQGSGRPVLEEYANDEGENRGQGRNSGCISEESLLHSPMEVKSLSLILASLSKHLGILQ